MSQEKPVLRFLSFSFFLLAFSLAHAQAQVTVTCTLPATAQVGVVYTGASCAGAGGTGPYTYSISAGALPGGLSLNTGTGAITGTPTTAGSTYAFTVSAKDSSAVPVSGSLAVTNFTVLPPTLTLSCVLPATAQVGVLYTGASCSGAGGTTPYAYSISAGALPGGVSLNTSTGAITGTPTTAGSTYAFTVKVTDSGAVPQSATQATANFVVSPAALTLTCTLPVTAQVGVVYTGASCAGAGGTTPYTYSISAGALPGGLSLNTSTGAITGTPTTAGSTYAFTVKVTDSSTVSQSATQATTNFVVSPPALTLTCTLPATAQVGVVYTGASCAGAGGTTPYAYSISAGALPGGLSLNTSTGAITGTPTTAGSAYAFTVKVIDSAAVPQSATQATTNFVVSPAALTLTCTLPATAQVGVSYTGASCAGAGGTTPYTYAISAGALPGGLSLNTSTGAITGTPTTAGSTYAFTVKVTDSSVAPQTATKATTNFVVSPAGLTLTCTLPATAQVGVSYTGASCAGAGGTSPYAYSISAGALPGGLSLNASTGAITGTPTTAGSTYAFTVKVTDSAAVPQTATQATTNFVVSAATLTLTCTLPATAQVGVAYTGASCAAAGGTTPYAYSISAGALPGGLSLNTSTGAITGTPTTAGTAYAFTVKVTDSAAVPQTATQATANFVVSAATLTLTCTLPATAQVGVAYSGAGCAGAGGTTPYTYSVSAGALPGGLSLNPSTGAITGTPTNAGNNFAFTIKVIDSGTPAQNASQATANFVVSAATLTLTCTLPPTAQVGVAYTGASCGAAGGTTPYAYSISAGALPGGLSLNTTTGAITGTPTSAGTAFAFTVKATDAGSQTATQAVTGFVVSPPLLTLSCTLPAGAQVGVAYNTGQCQGSGGTTPFTYLITASALPSGMTLNSSTGAVTGVPSVAGTFGFTVKVTDSGTPAQTATQVVTGFAVAPATLTLTCTAPNQGIVGAAYSANCNAAGGTTPYTYSISSGSLPGVNVNQSNGSLSGTLSTAGTYTLTIKAQDSGNPTQAATQTFTVKVIPVLSVTTTSLSNGIVGITYSAACNATGGTTPYAYSISAGALPTGLSLNASTCAITGTPSASGTFNFSLLVTDSTVPTQSATQPLSITVNPALAITSNTAPNGSVGLAYAFALTAQNGTTPYSWSLSSGALPAGLSLNPSTGLISGTPTTSSTYTFTVKVTDSGSPVQTQTHTFTAVSIAAGLTITTTSVANGLVGSPYSAALTAQNGQAPYTWSIAAGAFPGGLALTNGSITGTPNAAGTFFFTVKVTDSTSPSALVASQQLSITIAPVLVFTSTGFPNGVVGSPYAAGCVVAGGTPAYSYSISAGALPAGLSINATNCTINGTPSGASGTFNFTVKATDSGNPVQTAAQAYSITIGQGLTITSGSVPNGFTGLAYSTTLTAQNGTAPYTWTRTAGALPTGLTLNANGTISGTPTAVGTYSFTVKVTDSGNPVQSATQTFSNVSVAAGLTITSTSLAAATQSIPYSATLTAANGNGALTWSWSAASGSTLPGGLTLSTAGVLSGSATTPGTYSFTVSVKDSGTPQQSASQLLSLVVSPYTAPQVPTFTFTGFPTSQTPGVTVTGTTVALSPTSSAAWPISISIGFTPNAAGVSAGYIDPAVQFIDSTGTKLGTTYNVTVPALATSVTLPQIAPGTVAGKIGFTLTVSGQTGASSSITVPASAPIITPGSVQILNVSSTGFDVEVIANSSPRDLKTATFSFGAASGAVINGTTTYSVDVTSLMSGWYGGTASQQYGSAFMLTVPFTFTGSSSAISSVAVTLTNSVGNSATVTGTK